MFNFKPLILNFQSRGFTLLEIMIALSVIGGLLVTLIYTLNYNLSIAERHESSTISTMLAKEKMAEMELNPVSKKGEFPLPHAGYSFKTEVMESVYPEMVEVSVTVSDGKDTFRLTSLIRKKEQ